MVLTLSFSSAVQLHPSATVILDEPTASGLTMRDYFNWVIKEKPDAPQT